MDRDDLDAALQRWRPEVRLEGPLDLALSVSALEDLHPDRLFERLDAFATLHTTRRRLHDPDGFRAAAAEVRRWMATEGAASEAQVVVQSLLAGGGKAREAKANEEWAVFVRQIVAPHLVAREDPQRPALVAAVDRATETLMRSILHHPTFQAFEASWRAVEFLTRRLETGSDLQLRLLDVSRSDLVAALDGSDPARARMLRRTLIDDPAVPWAVMVGDYTFGPTAEDVASVGALARLAREVGAPFIAAASPRLLGVDALEGAPDPDRWRLDGQVRDDWQAVRASADAEWLGLALPRFLLRLPYGQAGERLESFAFEELSSGVPHEEYLWGGPAFACACLLGRAFSEEGWALRPQAAELADLPLYVEEKDGERRVKACAEVVLTVRTAEAILDRGFMPLVSFRDRDVVRLARFQSVADPLSPLAGPWAA